MDSWSYSWYVTDGNIYRPSSESFGNAKLLKPFTVARRGLLLFKSCKKINNISTHKAQVVRFTESSFCTKDYFSYTITIVVSRAHSMGWLDRFNCSKREGFEFSAHDL